MTEREKMTTTTPDQQPGKPLSTADVAAASELARQPEKGEQPDTQASAVPVMDSAAPERIQAQPVQLLANEELQKLRSRWGSIQIGFVDEPRRAVEEADSLVAEMMQRLAQLFADERNKLESQWSRGDDVSTEDLRVALQRYRSFFDRLLSI